MWYYDMTAETQARSHLQVAGQLHRLRQTVSEVQCMADARPGCDEVAAQLRLLLQSVDAMNERYLRGLMASGFAPASPPA